MSEVDVGQGSPEESAEAKKAFRGATERVVFPAETLRRVRPLLGGLGITRVANITGLDRIGIPVVAAYRPNARSLSVSQGKGVTADQAAASGIMESIESHHAENFRGPLVYASKYELARRFRLVDTDGLPRLTVSRFDEHRAILWAQGTELMTGAPTLVPYESVHTNFALPLPAGSGAFLMSSNGLASGNHVLEAIGHGLCELLERDANTLWTVRSQAFRRSRRIALSTVDDPDCRALLGKFETAAVLPVVWETTSDLGVASFLCTVVDCDPLVSRPMAPSSGAGCHPKKRIALIRALTEAAQSRLTVISGARDDIDATAFDTADAVQRSRELRSLAAEFPGTCSFDDVPDIENDDFAADVRCLLERLARAGCGEAAVVNLTEPSWKVPVVKVVVPYLEAMADLPGYVLGARARRAAAE